MKTTIAIQTDESVLHCSLGEAVSSAAKKRVAFIMKRFAATIVGEMQALLSSYTSDTSSYHNCETSIGGLCNSPF